MDIALVTRITSTLTMDELSIIESDPNRFIESLKANLIIPVYFPATKKWVSVRNYEYPFLYYKKTISPSSSPSSSSSPSPSSSPKIPFVCLSTLLHRYPPDRAFVFSMGSIDSTGSMSKEDCMIGPAFVSVTNWPSWDIQHFPFFRRLSTIQE
jgi:hypothetical protein